MILDSIDNLKSYSSYNPLLEKVSEFIASNNLASLEPGRHNISEDLYVVIVNDEQPTFNHILEAHNNWIDVHYTIDGMDVVQYRQRSSCKQIEKEYDLTDDYILYKETSTSSLQLESNYFLMIEPSMAHMAMCGNGKLHKAIFKLKVK